MEFIEKLLQDAADRGEFDAGSAAGKPLRIEDAGPGWWGRREAARIAAEEHAAAEIQATERALGQVWRLPSEAAVRKRVETLNERLLAAGTTDAALDADEIVRTWKRMVRLRTR